MSFITLFCRKNVKRAVEVQPDQGENVSASASSPSRKGTLRWRYRRRRQQEQQQQQQQWKQRSPTPSLVFEYLVLHLFVILGSLSMASGFYSGETPGRARKNVPTPTRGGKLSCARNEPGRHSLAPLSPPVLELITPDGCASSSSSETSSLLHCIQRAVAGGVSLVQLRDYKSDAKSKAELAVRLAAATEGRALFVVNGDPDDAHASGADGVHLPERMIDRLVGLRVAGEWPRVVGCSVHSVPAAVKAAKLGADYVQVGTMFATQSHPGKEPEGLGLLDDVKRQLRAEKLESVWVVGVGGIDASNCGKVVAAGGDGVAAIRCLCASSDAEGEARRMVQRMRGNLAASGCVGSLDDGVR